MRALEEALPRELGDQARRIKHEAFIALRPRMSVAAALRALGMARATYYDRRRTAPRRGRELPRPPRRRQPRALDEKERQAILDALHSERSIDLSPREVYATLLDEGVYLG